jgi:hypothetical protein
VVAISIKKRLFRATLLPKRQIHSELTSASTIQGTIRSRRSRLRALQTKIEAAASISKTKPMYAWSVAGVNGHVLAASIIPTTGIERFSVSIGASGILVPTQMVQATSGRGVSKRKPAAHRR